MCVICISDNINQNLSLACNHSFHLRCLTKWWITQYETQNVHSCPLCRYEPEEDELEYILLRSLADMWMRRKARKGDSFNRFIIKIKNNVGTITSMWDLIDAPEFVY